jgi:hypothetical protein
MKRPCKGEIPRIYDFRDDVKPLISSAKARDKVYRKEWGL